MDPSLLTITFRAFEGDIALIVNGHFLTLVPRTATLEQVFKIVEEHKTPPYRYPASN